MADQPHEMTSKGSASSRTLPLVFARAFALTFAFVYPAYWCAQFAAGSLPALLRTLLGANQLKDLRISLYGSALLSGPGSTHMPTNYGSRMFGGEMLLGIAVVVALGALVFYWTCRRGGLLGGLFVAMLGYAGFSRLLRQLWFESPGISWVAAALVLGALWTMGLRRCIAETARPRDGYGWRFAAAVFTFTVPAGAMWLTLHWTIDMRVVRPFVWLFLPGLVPVALASWRPLSGRTARPRTILWPWAGAGVATTVAFAAALAWGGPHLEKSFIDQRAAAAQAMVEKLPAPSLNAPYPKKFFQRGVNFTAEFGAPYASVDALKALGRLPPYGVNAVALVAYGWMRPGQPEVRIGRGLNVWESDEGIADLARMAHSLGMKVLLKPQLWVRGGSTTRIDFRDPAERAEWFAQYGKFIDHYARLATRIHADLFSVGVELGRLSRYDAAWRNIISKVRRIYPGPLVYAANFGNDFEDVKFWDALDYIGLDEYYALPESLSTRKLVRRVERVEVEYRKPVIFTEVGFPSRADAQRQPWRDLRDNPVSIEDQARCYRAIFRAFYTKPWFEGLYWWKVGTNGEGGPGDGSFTPWGKPAMEVLRKWYTNGDR